MTITYPLTPPSSPGFAGVRLRHSEVVAVSRSPFTLEEQVYRHPGQVLRGEFTLPVMDRAEAEAWIAFLLSLKGPSGTFLMGIAGCETPRGTLGGTPLVNGGSQTGESLAIDGATPNTSNWIRAGDWIQLGTGLNAHLHKVLADASANSSGELVLDIWPRLRASPADDSAVVTSSPVGLWRLEGGDVEYDLSPPLLFGMTFRCVEARNV